LGDYQAPNVPSVYLQQAFNCRNLRKKERKKEGGVKVDGKDP